MIKYVPNNLGFRIISSKVMEAYKNSQAFNLSEISRDETHKFSNTAKEILLLKYDLWCRWLVDAEAAMREHNSYDKKLRLSLISMSNIIEMSYISIMKNNPDNFDKDFVAVWLKIHKGLYDYLTEAIIKFEANSMIELMTRIGDVLIKVMDATLHELYELDNTYSKHHEIFVSVTDVCYDYTKVFKDKCLLGERLNTLKDEGLIDVDSVVIKNYIDEDIDDIVESIEKYGYKVSKIL